MVIKTHVLVKGNRIGKGDSSARNRVKGKVVSFDVVLVWVKLVIELYSKIVLSYSFILIIVFDVTNS